MPYARASRQRGLTLVEAIVVITLVGVVGTLVSGLLRYPLNAYVDLTRRTEITDAADTALRRMARELQGALPNSVRVSGNYIEFLPVVTAGRYRAAPSSSGVGDMLDFNSPADDRFDVLGPAVTVSAGDQLVIHNLGLPEADAYVGSNRRNIPAAGSGITTLVYQPGGTQFPFGSPTNRFFVVNRPVSFVCLPGPNGSGTLRRVSGYAIQAAQPVSMASLTPSPAPAGYVNSLLAPMVTSCSFAYGTSASSRNGIVTLQLTLSGGGESITLLQQLHVGNSP